jgi:hypothetical protein
MAYDLGWWLEATYWGTAPDGLKPDARKHGAQ